MSESAVMSKSELAVVGKSVARLDAVEKATGRARFTPDLKLPGMLRAAILRSPHAHARVLGVDTSRAERVPGVKAVLTRRDVPQRRFRSTAMAVPGPPLPMDRCTFDEKVRFAGEAVAAVAAVSQNVAREALELIRVEYEPLPAVFDPEEALAEDAPLIHEHGNVASALAWGWGNLEEGFAASDFVFEDEYRTPAVEHCSLETQAYLCDVDPGGKLTVWASTQFPHGLRQLLAEALEVPSSKIRVIMPHVGGAFGCKEVLAPDVLICTLLARKAHRPVSLHFSRHEEFVDSRTRHASIVRLKVGVARDGSIRAIQARAITNTGAYLTHGAGVLGTVGGMLGTKYRCPNFQFEGRCVYTNLPTAGAYRGFGAPQAHFAVESLMDMVAEKLGMDPIELTIKNHAGVGDPGPAGFPIDSSGLEECLARGKQLIGWERRRQPGEGDGPKKRGLGLATMLFISGAGGLGSELATAQVQLHEDGTASLVVSAADLGTGSRTALAQIAAEELGIRFEDLTVTMPDTDATPFDNGSYASRTTYVYGNAVKEAAAEARGQLLERAAQMLEADARDLEIRDRVISVKGVPGRTLTVKDVTRAAALDVAPGRATAFMGACSFAPRNAAPFGAQFAEVEVDTETGRIDLLRMVAAHDVGRAINPIIVEGQIEGALQHGIGYALSEVMQYDEQGRLLNGNFADYKLLTAPDMPAVETAIVEAPSPSGPYGAKGVGEPGLIPTAAAIANAVYNATGVRVKTLPITRDKVLAGLGRLGPIGSGQRAVGS